MSEPWKMRNAADIARFDTEFTGGNVLAASLPLYFFVHTFL
jgi:hypothetical protein